MSRSGTPWRWGIPVLFLLLLAATIWGLVRGSASRLEGELSAHVVQDPTLEPALIRRTWINLPPAERDVLLSILEKTPVPLTSELMETRVSGAEEGLRVDVAAGVRTSFYRVSLQSDPGLVQFSRDHTERLDAVRRAHLDQATVEFLQQFRLVRNGSAHPSELTRFRDGLCLASLVGGVGYHLAAVVGTTEYRCVYEDPTGSVYFLLPPGTRTFRVTGRSMPDGDILFPGDFVVMTER